MGKRAFETQGTELAHGHFHEVLEQARLWLWAGAPLGSWDGLELRGVGILGGWLAWTPGDHSQGLASMRTFPPRPAPGLRAPRLLSG